MTTRATLPAFAAVVGLQLLLTMRRDALPEVAPWRTEGVVRPTPTDAFDDGCSGPLWGSTRTRALCTPPSATPINAEVHRSAQTDTGGDDGDEARVSVPAESKWSEMPLGVTDGLQPEAVGQSRRLYRRQKRHRRRVSGVSESDDDEAPPWMVGALAGLTTGLVLVHPPAACAVWACVTAVTGVWMLATDRHFWWPVCGALSFNYWCAAAWVACTVSFEVGAGLAALAVAVRGSVLLFPVKRKGNAETREAEVAGVAAEADDAGVHPRASKRARLKPQYPPSAEQQAIIDTFKGAPPTEMVRVQACAGSGKSVTLGHVLAWAAEQGKVRTLVTGFANTTIDNVVDEVQGDLAIEDRPFRLREPGIYVSTLHKIGKVLFSVSVDETAPISAAQKAFSQLLYEGERLHCSISLCYPRRVLFNRQASEIAECLN